MLKPFDFFDDFERDDEARLDADTLGSLSVSPLRDDALVFLIVAVDPDEDALPEAALPAVVLPDTVFSLFAAS